MTLRKSEYLFPSIPVCLFESFSDFPVLHSYFTYETDSQRTYCASFDRMLVYRQLSAGIAKFCVSVGEIESSLRGNVSGVFAESDFYWFSYQRNLITEDVVYVTSRKHKCTYTRRRVHRNSKENGRCTLYFGLIMKLLFM